MTTARLYKMELSISNKQRSVRVELGWLRAVSAAALEACVPLSGDGRFALRELAEVEVAIVSDAVIARVHVEFMGIAGATDVITFAHGELVISAQTAAACAKEHGHSGNARAGKFGADRHVRGVLEAERWAAEPAQVAPMVASDAATEHRARHTIVRRRHAVAERNRPLPHERGIAEPHAQAATNTQIGGEHKMFARDHERTQ